MENSVFLTTLCLVLYYHFFKELILLALFAYLHRGLVVAIQIIEVDLVAVLIFKGVEASIGAFFQQELRQIRRWNEIVVLRAVVTAVSFTSLTSVLLLLYIMNVLEMRLWLLQVASVLLLVRVVALLLYAELCRDAPSWGVLVAVFNALIF